MISIQPPSHILRHRFRGVVDAFRFSSQLQFAAICRSRYDFSYSYCYLSNRDQGPTKYNARCKRRERRESTILSRVVFHKSSTIFIAAKKETRSTIVAIRRLPRSLFSRASGIARSIKIAFLSIAIAVNSITLRHRANPPGKDCSVPLLYDDVHHRRPSL